MGFSTFGYFSLKRETFCHPMSLMTRVFIGLFVGRFSRTGTLEGNQHMSTVEAAFLSLLVIALVAIVALFRFDKEITFIGKVVGAYFKLKGSIRPRVFPPKKPQINVGQTIAPPAPPVEPFHFAAWLSRRWLKISVPFALILLLIVMPLWWWNSHPEFWKLELSHHVTEAWSLWKQGPKATIHEAQSGRTLQGLTRLLDDYADILGRDPHRVIELWVVDHYWQYWSTDTFNDYVRANRKFVDSGGKIHRMFILTPGDLRNPQVTAVLRNQCEKIGADVWRGDVSLIANKAEYQVTEHAFHQMPYTETGFQTFDVLQLEDLTYYSSDFSPDYRVVGSSTWSYGQTLDLKPLFNKSIAQRIDCSLWRNPEVAQVTQRQ
jgi:hypothetical protein